jgi:hypothetical protein
MLGVTCRYRRRSRIVSTSQAAVPLAAGVFNFCLAGPLFGIDLMGRKPAEN